MSDTTANDELRGLIKLWRGMSENDATPEPNSVTLEWCADELEAAINDEC